MRSIGLDIGEYSVKLVELAHNQKQASINQVQEKVLSQNISAEDKELEVIEFVRNFLSTGDYSQVRWIVAVRQDQVTTRYKNFPFSDRIKIQKSLSFEMEEDIPFDTDSCIFDAKVIQTQGLSSDILATAIPKYHIEKLVDTSNSCGIDIHAVTIEGLAFANLVENWEAAPPIISQDISLNSNDQLKKNIQIVLNIGHKKTLFTAFENNRLIFSRSLFWGAAQLITEIIRREEISYVEAVQLLQKKAFLVLSNENMSFEQIEFSNYLSKALNDLVSDIQMTIIEIQSEFNAKITSLHFTGGLSSIPNLGAFLTKNLEVSCNPVNLLQNFSSTSGGLNHSQQDIELRFSLAVAIALEAFKKPRNPATNLLKGEFAKQNDSFKFFWQKWGAVCQMGIAALFVLFIWTSFRDSFSLALNEKGDEAIVTQAKAVAKLPKKQANESGVKKYIKLNKKKAKDLKLISDISVMNSALDVLKKLSESSPSRESVKIDIMTFQVKDDLVQIVGYASGPKDITNLSQSLKSISIDGNVNNQSATGLALVPNRTAFNLSFKADRGLIK